MTTDNSLGSEMQDTTSGALDDANSIVLRLDGNGRIVSLNPFGMESFGYKESQIVGRHPVGTIIPKKDHTGGNRLAMFSDLLRRPDAYTHQVNENCRRNGDRVWVIWSNRAFRDASGIILQILCLGDDITDRKTIETVLEEAKVQLNATVQEQNTRLQEAISQLKEEVEARKKTQRELADSRDRYLLLHQASTEGILFHNKGIAIEVNDAFTQKVECLRDRLIGMNVFDHFVAPEDRRRVELKVTAGESGRQLMQVCSGFIQKPIRMIALSKKIREILEAQKDAHS